MRRAVTLNLHAAAPHAQEAVETREAESTRAIDVYIAALVPTWRGPYPRGRHRSTLRRCRCPVRSAYALTSIRNTRRSLSLGDSTPATSHPHSSLIHWVLWRFRPASMTKSRRDLSNSSTSRGSPIPSTPGPPPRPRAMTKSSKSEEDPQTHSRTLTPSTHHLATTATAVLRQGRALKGLSGGQTTGTVRNQLIGAVTGAATAASPQTPHPILPTYHDIPSRSAEVSRRPRLSSHSSVSLQIASLGEPELGQREFQTCSTD